MRFEIARSLNGNKVLYIARDTNGTVRLRADTEEEIHEAIRHYNEMFSGTSNTVEKSKSKSKSKDIDEKNDNGLEDKETAMTDAAVLNDTEPTTKDNQDIQSDAQTTSTPNDDSQKKFLQNNLKEQIEEKKKKSKKSFWDKLK